MWLTPDKQEAMIMAMSVTMITMVLLLKTANVLQFLVIWVMFLRNHGFVACGTTVAEAFHLVYNLVLACDIQVRAVRVGVDNLIFASEDAQQKVADLTKAGGGGVNKQSESQTKINWKIGELEFEAWMRVLDNAGFRTGHIYRHPISSSRPPQQHSDIMTPPAASSRGLLDETESAAM
ncbi:alpha-adducin (Erythrocyte adducin subunit alpha) [Trichinella spiralis]|uniref:alpha-adducin (Erythrocyte adducin subunit alpha) n=1 Tax=Trichinella spiralis TaxID=6334 RepID=UPI0001EFD67E|nr:alpha-adducin (Erythrocyte adducin subunit alpha) [Trichinella spiralis]